MKNKNLAVWICIVLSLILSAVAIILRFIPLNTEKNATAIYDECLYNVVEVKAVSESVGESYGTAEIINENGTLITNAHVVTYTRLSVVNTFDEYYVRFSYEDDYRAVSLEKYDSDLDIAILSINDITDINIVPIKTGDSDALKSGNTVYAVGNASNYGIGIFQGIISVPLVNIELDGLIRSVIQCDLTIAAGNSGGTLLNADGELVGITTFRTKDTSGNVIYGIVYCIPINTVLEYINN